MDTATVTEAARDPRVQRVYVRRLPGGGYVAIDVAPTRSLLYGRRYHGTLTLERRSTPRAGGRPPVIGEATASSIEAVVQQLLPAAECNTTIGAAVLRRERALR